MCHSVSTRKTAINKSTPNLVSDLGGIYQDEEVKKKTKTIPIGEPAYKTKKYVMILEKNWFRIVRRIIEVIKA